MKRLLFILLFSVVAIEGFAQPIVTSTNQYTIYQLVKEKLFSLSPGTNGNACTGSISNISWNVGGTANPVNQNSIGYFTNTNPTFPLNSGIIMTTGVLTAAPGPNANTQSANTGLGDNQLLTYMQSLGLSVTSYNDAAILEFDFVPLTNTMSFDFLFASEEYGTWQCDFSDAFAFFLKDVTANSPVTNLASVPNVTPFTPISVVTVRDQANNGGCPSVNPNYFGVYNAPGTPNTATNFNGHTIVMTARSNVVPNHLYHIKLVIADRNDNAFDSAIFLGAGSFNFPIQTNGWGSNGFLESDGTAICYGQTRVVQAQLSPTPGVTYTWKKNGVAVPNSNNNNYTISTPGTYNVTVTFANGSQSSSCPFVVEYFPALPLGNPVDLYAPVASPIFNFTPNKTAVLNGQSATNYPVKFHHTLQNAIDFAAPITNITNYTGYDGEVIYMSLEDGVSGNSCNETRSFILHLTTQPTAGSNGSVTVCRENVGLINLASLITGEDTGGVWTYTSGSGGTFDAANGTYTPSATSSSVNEFTYTITPVLPLLPVSSVATVNIIPSHGMVLSSASGTPDQVVCINTPITDITYTLSGGATGATVTGLPAGVSSSVSGNTLTISGTPTTVTGSPFAFNITTTGNNCTVITMNGTITVNPVHAIALSSLPATETQTVCINSAITDITYTLSGGATGATVTGLPAGVTSSVTGNTLTITGTPSTLTGSPFIYAITTTGNSCTVATEGGTITVDPIHAIALSSAAATETQTLCINTPITDITYTLSGGATGATVTGLPAGVTASVTGNTLTITGTPTTTTGSPFTYAITTTGNTCTVATEAGTITVDPVHAIALSSLSATETQTVCINSAITDITYTLSGGATGATVTGLPAGVTSSVTGNTLTITGTPSTLTGSPFIYAITTTGNSCTVATEGGTITVDPIHAIALSSAAATETQTLCINTPITDITYTLSGGATGATVTGLPAGVTASVTGNTLTITGTPTTTTGSPFTYAITTTGNTCTVATEAGTITVEPVHAIALSSLPATETQTVCINSAITDITYTLSGGATGATVTGLPAGVTSSVTGTTLTITGTPSTLTGSPFIYAITTTGNSCIVATESGTITVDPIHAIALSSAAATETQTLCINTPITDITYTLSGGATGATVTGLPAGVTASVTGNTLTITGTPTTTTGSPFTYAITTTGNACTVATEAGTITVDPVHAIALSSLSATESQTVCINSAITDITYTLSGGATGATVTGLPAGVTSSVTGNTLTITGTPSTLTGSPFIYAITTTGNSCTVATESGTITVDPIHAIALSSAAATETQTLCINTPITDITYTLSGGATGATVTGLPAGVTASVTGNTLTITGTPTTTTGSPFTYAITTTGNTCTVATEAGTITLNPVHVISLSSIASTANQTLCFGSSISNITYTLSGGATGATVTGLPTGVTSSVTGSTLTITGTPTSALGSPYTIDITTTGNGCAVATASASITIVGAPNILTPTPYVVCDDTLNNDGIYCFNLASKNAEITTDPTVSITYHVTPSDAQTGLNPLSTTSYCVNAAGGLPVYVRVFDPAAPQCPSTVTFQLVVNRLPTVGSITDYQLCDDNNTGDQKEIFDLTTKTTEILGATQLPSDYTVTFYTTQPAAQAGVAGTEITTPTVFQNTINPQTIYVRVVNNTTGCVNATASFILRVNPLPTVLTPFPAYALCDMDQTEIGKEPFNLSSQISSILQGQTSMNVQFYPTLADAQNDPPTNEITTATYTNTQVNSQTIGVRITNTTTGCYATSTLELIVNPLPVLVAQAAPYVLCDSDQNGDTVFDLCSLTSLIDPNSNYTITYHATLPNAQDDVNPLACSYPNNQIGTQILFVRGEDSLGCYSVIQIELIVNPSPEVVTLTSLVECDYDSNPQNGQTSFDLEQQTQTILNGQPTAGSNYIVKYYDNQTNAEDLQFAISITTNYIGSNNQTIWYTVQDIASGCYAVGSFTLVVNAPTVLTTPTLLKVCDTDSIPNDEFTTFDIANYIGVVPGHTLSFYIDSAFTNLITTPTAFINTISANQTIYVQAINNATGCISTRTLTLSVLKIPTPNTDPMELTQCDDNAPGDGVEVFDLTQNESYIMNADSTVTLHYYPSYTDAVNNTNEILDPTAANVGANVWIRVSSNNFIDSFSENCYVLVEQPIVVNPLPTVNASISAYELCDVNNPGDQKEFFNLTTKTVEILGATQLPSDYTVRFYTTQPAAQAGVAGTEIANPTAFENTSNPQTIYVRVINNATGCVNATAGFELKVNPLPSATAPIDFVTCDTDLLNDGFFNYPLNDLVDDVLGSQSPLNFTVTFYNNQTDAQNGTNQILDEPNYMIYTHRVWIRVTNNTTGCFVLTSFNAQVERLAEPLIVTQNNVNTICVDFDTKVVVRPLLLEATNTVPGSYTYEWFEASAPTTVIGTSSTLWVDTAEPNGATRSYTVVMTSTSGLNNPACSNVSDTFEVIQSGQAVVVGTNPAYVVSNYFDNNQTITVENIDGYGTYQYSLDNGPRQDSPVFENVAFGTHFITIWDTEGGLAASCDPMYIEGIQTIDYPRYFTPNGDGIQDTWNIFGLSDQVNAKIYIFDRFGKLIKQITPQGQGWDGTFNGNPLPSTDYWFTVEYLEATTTKEFKAHFTLKR